MIRPPAIAAQADVPPASAGFYVPHAPDRVAADDANRQGGDFWPGRLPHFSKTFRRCVSATQNSRRDGRFEFDASHPFDP
jgi:hypothetical protein